jgi:hypothetical protein
MRNLRCLPVLIAVLVACGVDDASAPLVANTPPGVPPGPTQVTPSGQVVPAPRVPTAVVMQHGDLARTGANLTENVLSPETVSQDKFGLLFTREVQGHVYAQPLYVPNLDMGANGKHDVLFVATEHNDVYAFDVKDPSAHDPIWHVSTGPSIPTSDFDIDGMVWHDITVEVGITSTPAIDLAAGVMYVVAKTKEDGTEYYRIHALDLATGKERAGSPATISVNIPSNGPDTIAGRLPFVPFFQLQRPAITLSNGVLYIGFGSHGDWRAFHGWLLAYDAASLTLRGAFATTPNVGYGGAIWQAGQGPTIDDQGNVYFLTGNGTYDPTREKPDLGDTFVKLHLDDTDLRLVDWFTPFNQAELEADDLDLGSAGALFLNVGGTRRVVGGGKEGKLYVLDPDSMGKFHQDDDSQIVQTLFATQGIIHGAPVWFKNRIYIGGQMDMIHAYEFEAGAFHSAPFTESAPVNDAILAISADGDKGGIVWSMEPVVDNDDGNRITAGALRAYDAEDLSRLLYDSQAEVAGQVGQFAKFCPAAIADGKVFVPSHAGKIGVYGLK